MPRILCPIVDGALQGAPEWSNYPGRSNNWCAEITGMDPRQPGGFGRVFLAYAHGPEATYCADQFRVNQPVAFSGDYTAKRGQHVFSQTYVVVDEIEPERITFSTYKSARAAYREACARGWITTPATTPEIPVNDPTPMTAENILPAKFDAELSAFLTAAFPDLEELEIVCNALEKRYVRSLARLRDQSFTEMAKIGFELPGGLLSELNRALARPAPPVPASIQEEIRKAREE